MTDNEKNIDHAIKNWEKLTKGNKNKKHKNDLLLSYLNGDQDINLFDDYFSNNGNYLLVPNSKFIGNDHEKDIKNKENNKNKNKNDLNKNKNDVKVIINDPRGLMINLDQKSPKISHSGYLWENFKQK